jgi:hypothetical protein
VLPHLKKLILSESREIQKEACWTLSNIAAGSTDQIEKVFALDVVGILGNYILVYYIVSSSYRFKSFQSLWPSQQLSILMYELRPLGLF